MPCWAIHLAVAKVLNKNYHLNKDLFYYGNVLPDVLKTNIYSRNKTHFYGETKHIICKEENIIELPRFLKTYEDRLDREMIIGYYTHLLTDYFYNDEIYTKSFVIDSYGNIIGIKLLTGEIISLKNNSHNSRRYFKQKDFIRYGKYLFEENLVAIPTNKKLIATHLLDLKPPFISSYELDERIHYLSSPEFRKYYLNFNNNFKLFTKEEYDKMFTNCLDYVDDKVKTYTKIK
jgi:hypothetical protein